MYFFTHVRTCFLLAQEERDYCICKSNANLLNMVPISPNNHGLKPYSLAGSLEDLTVGLLLLV